MDSYAEENCPTGQETLLSKRNCHSLWRKAHSNGGSSYGSTSIGSRPGPATPLARGRTRSGLGSPFSNSKSWLGSGGSGGSGGLSNCSGDGWSSASFDSGSSISASINAIERETFAPQNFMCSVDPAGGKFLGASVVFRGFANKADVELNMHLPDMTDDSAYEDATDSSSTHTDDDDGGSGMDGTR
eukprot:Lankesteria_metandrocarpae@DN9372_c0_g1_i1.p1